MQTSSSIPHGLRAPVPETPWNFSPTLFERVRSQPDDPSFPFKRCKVLPSDPEADFILRYFMHSKPPKYGIKAIWAIHHPQQAKFFESGIGQMEGEAKNPVYKPVGKEEEPKEDRAKVIQRWKTFTDSFSPFTITLENRKTTYTEAKVLPLWHGASLDVCISICNNGFTSFGKHHHFSSAAKKGANESTDIGYFGSGKYFTNSAWYSTRYSLMSNPGNNTGHLLLAWASMREPHAVVSDVSHPDICSDMKMLKGKEHYQNYNAHYIPVASIEPSDPNCMTYFPCYKNQAPAWDEVVVFEKYQTLARFYIELSVDSPEYPLKNTYFAPFIQAPSSPPAPTLSSTYPSPTNYGGYSQSSSGTLKPSPPAPTLSIATNPNIGSQLSAEDAYEQGISFYKQKSNGGI